ncbi:MAG: histidinol phosphate phosphatase domain-containing protein [Deltaproteobacteria bacterium]|nr:histidinol phosphate phosphatase domain-containing protein [Deltaproteobacteria bacterium]
MIDLHTHSIFSDGELIPSELARRAKVMGYHAMAITDHGDHSNIDFIVPRIVKVCQEISASYDIQLVPGIELTHVPPIFIAELAKEARRMGARIVVVHGETIVEPVIVGTNAAAIEASVDILAHPGLLTEEDALLAARKSVFLEISARKGHSLTNGHVVTVARQCKASLVLNTDSHSPHDLIHAGMARKIAEGAGMTAEEVETMFKNSENIVRKALSARKYKA